MSLKRSTVKEISNLTPVVFEDLFTEDTKQAIKEVFNSKRHLVKNQDVEIVSIPFNHCVIKNFLRYKDGSPATDFVKLLGSELLKLNFHQKSNDLYKFRQTNELMMASNKDAVTGFHESNQCLNKFSLLLQNTMLPWLRDVTDSNLNDVINMFSAQYSSTDHLLCHDDQLEKRRLAYVYYLTPDWTEEDGGSLDLYDAIVTNSHLHPDPGSIVKSINPSFNSLVFFEVSPSSFHQVAEVLSTSKTRLSLTGWFHGPVPTIHQPPIAGPSPTSEFIPAEEDEIMLHKWVNPMYMNPVTQGSIQEQFVDDSEIQLPGFLLGEQHQSIQESFRLLDSIDDAWDLRGPPNKCRYHEIKLNGPSRPQLSGPKVSEALSKVRSLLDLFRSEEMFLFLSNISGLSLHPMAVDSDSEDEATASKRAKLEDPGSKPCCRCRLLKWGRGSYTLVRDTDSERGEYALDVNLFFCPPDWEEGFGGTTSYIASGEAEELLTILPQDNALTLTYRDKESIRFVKYLNHTSVRHFHDLSAVYYE